MALNIGITLNEPFFVEFEGEILEVKVYKRKGNYLWLNFSDKNKKFKIHRNKKWENKNAKKTEGQN